MSAQRRVARGAAYLDDVKPGWENNINVAELDLSYTNRCVLGQVFGHSYYAPVRTRFWPAWVVRHGFIEVRSQGPTHREWCRVILARRTLQTVKQRRLTAATETLLARSV